MFYCYSILHNEEKTKKNLKKAKAKRLNLATLSPKWIYLVRF
jgi:hypothetical protein